MDPVPAGLADISTDASQGAFTAPSWSVGTLDINDFATLTISGKVITSEVFTNIAEVSASEANDPDSTPNNNILAEDDHDSVTISPVSTTTTSTLTSSSSTSATTTTSTTASTTTFSTTSTTLMPPVIVDINADVTLWAVYTPTGTIVPLYSTNLGTMASEWLPVTAFTNTPIGQSNIMIEFDPPDTNALGIFYHLRQNP